MVQRCAIRFVVREVQKMIKIMLGEKSTDVTPQNWPQIREAIEKFYGSLNALEIAIGFSPSEVNISKKEQLINEAENVASDIPTPNISVPARSIPKAIVRQTENKKIVDYAVDALHRLGNWSTVNQIADSMEKNGWDSTYKNIKSRNETVRNTMRNYKDLLQNQGSMWGLIEWPTIEADELPSYIFDEYEDEGISPSSHLLIDDDDIVADESQNGVSNEPGPNFGKIP